MTAKALYESLIDWDNEPWGDAAAAQRVGLHLIQAGDVKPTSLDRFFVGLPTPKLIREARERDEAMAEFDAWLSS